MNEWTKDWTNERTKERTNVVQPINEQTKPTNEIDMLEIDGVGPTKFKKYGELFIDLINKHI